MLYTVIDGDKVLLETKSWKEAFDFKEQYYKDSNYTTDPHIKSHRV